MICLRLTWLAILQYSPALTAKCKVKYNSASSRGHFRLSGVTIALILSDSVAVRERASKLIGGGRAGRHGAPMISDQPSMIPPTIPPPPYPSLPSPPLPLSLSPSLVPIPIPIPNPYLFSPPSYMTYLVCTIHAFPSPQPCRRRGIIRSSPRMPSALFCLVFGLSPSHRLRIIVLFGSSIPLRRFLSSFFYINCCTNGFLIEPAPLSPGGRASTEDVGDNRPPE